MQRVRIRFRPQALQDLRDIFDFVLKLSRSPVVARRFVGRVRLRCQTIANAPHGGRPRNDLEPGLRIVPFEHSAVIAYKFDGELVLVTNIFYGRRNYEALYSDDQLQ